MNKEQAYDEKIFPLMKEIISVCNKHKIAHLCHFELGGDGDDALCCTSANTSENRQPSDAIKKAVSLCHPSAAELIAFAISIKGPS